MATDKKIYTRRGDCGETDRSAGVRALKDDPAVEFCGAIDELSAALGLARSEELTQAHQVIVYRVQEELILLATEIVLPDPTGKKRIDASHWTRMESEIDEIESKLAPLDHFILPGDNRRSAQLHFARTICRRAERQLVTFLRVEPNLSETLLPYLNRLSDLLFVMARLEDKP